MICNVFFIQSKLFSNTERFSFVAGANNVGKRNSCLVLPGLVGESNCHSLRGVGGVQYGKVKNNEQAVITEEIIIL